MRAWFCLALAACGSSATTSGGGATVVSNTAVQSGPDVHRSRHAVVKAAAVALAAGDTEALVVLASPKLVYETAFTCSEANADDFAGRARTRFETAAKGSKGAKLEFLHIDQLTLADAAGFEPPGCDGKKTLAVHKARVKLKVDKDGKSRERTTEFALFELADRWYLAEVPADISADSETEQALEKLNYYSQRMCDCKDKACADQVNDEYTKWGTEMAKKASRYDRNEKYDPELIKQMTEAATRYTECYTKLAMAGAGTGGNPCNP